MSASETLVAALREAVAPLHLELGRLNARLDEIEHRGRVGRNGDTFPGASTSARGAACFPGSAAGSWAGGSDAVEWRLLPRNESKCRPLRRYITVQKSAACPKLCAAANVSLMASDLRDASVLMVGDSTSAYVLAHGCGLFSSTPTNFVPIGRLSRAQKAKYGHRLRSLDNHACSLAGNVSFGSFSHYGATGPPYWAYAYPLSPWLANTTAGQVRDDMPHFRERTRGADPTVVVASSGFWDISAYWLHETNATRGRWAVTEAHARKYVAGVHAMVRGLRRTFANSTVVWRLMHAGLKHSITPQVVKLFNDALRAAAPGWRLPLIDTEAMMRAVTPQSVPSVASRGRPYVTWSNLGCAVSHLCIRARMSLQVRHERRPSPPPLAQPRAAQRARPLGPLEPTPWRRAPTRTMLLRAGCPCDARAALTDSRTDPRHRSS